MKLWHWILISIAIAAAGLGAYFLFFRKTKPTPAAKSKPTAAGAASPSPSLADKLQDFTYSDGSYLKDGNYVDSNGNHIGWLDVNGNIWSDIDNTTFLGTSDAGKDGLPYGGLVELQGGSVSISQFIKSSLLV